MKPTFLTLARLSRAAFRLAGQPLGPIPPGWNEYARAHDKWSGFDATAFIDAAGEELVVCIRGQEVWRPSGFFADLRAVVRREVFRRLGRQYRYPVAGEDWVRDIWTRSQPARITVCGNSGGCGWAAAIVKRLGIPDPAIAFEGGARSLWTSDETNHRNVVSVEVVDKNGIGSQWGFSPDTPDRRFLVHRVTAHGAPAKGRKRSTYLHWPHLGIIDALEHQQND